MPSSGSRPASASRSGGSASPALNANTSSDFRSATPSFN